jgi:cation diffusion facilitator family transporter
MRVDPKAQRPLGDTIAGERRALWGSIIATGSLGGLGVVWGVVGGSQMILLDGAFAVVGLIMSLLLLQASVLSDRTPTDRYPYGFEAVVPLAIALQAIVMLGTLLYAAFDALQTIGEGGSEVAAGWAIAYGVLTTAGSVVVCVWLLREASTSDLLRSESRAWMVGALRGVGMVVGFTLLALLTGSRWEGAAPYVDPAMVLITCIGFLGTPISMLRSTFLELLAGAPPAELQEQVRAIVDQLQVDHELDPPELIMTKVGPKVYVEVDGTVGPEVTVTQEHVVREDLRRRLEVLPYEVWLNLEFRPRPQNGTGSGSEA